MLLAALAAAGTLTATALGASTPSTAAATVQVPTAKALADGSYTCTAAHAGLLDAQRRRIADASTIAEARELAVGPVKVAQRALAVAAFLIPQSDSLDDAKARLESFEEVVDLSSSQAEVAARFTELLAPDADSTGGPIQLADLQVGNADVDAGGCNYTTGEIIAVVIGFLLFIIPGIILLIVLC